MSGLLVHIHQKKKIALEITATVASVNGPSQRRDSIYFEFYCCVMYSGVEYVVWCYSECISHTRQAEKSA